MLRSALLLAALLLSAPCLTAEAGEAELLLLTEENWQTEGQLGKEGDAIIGDVVLRNEYLTAVIAQPLQSRNANMTVRDIGGALIDLTVTDRPNDQLSCYYPCGRATRFSEWSFQVDDETVELVDAPLGGGRAEVTVQTTGNDPIRVTYRLDSSSRYLTVIQEGASLSGKSAEIRFDAQKEDALKSPNGEGAVFWLDDRFWRQAYGWSVPEGELAFRSNPRLTTLDFRGEVDRRVIRVYAATNLCDIYEELSKASREQTGPLALTISTPTQLLPGARVELTNAAGYVGTLWTDGSGRIDQALPCGSYQLKVSRDGQPLLENVPIQIEPAINVYNFETELDFGLLNIAVQDSAGKPLPCKVQLNYRDGMPVDFGPESAVFGVRNVRYLANGREQLMVPAGEYEAIISYGPEYDASFQTVQVEIGKQATLTAALKRSVDTSGWVSAEFHSHSTPSGDNTSSQLGRVLNLLAEQIDYAPCTEHNRIDTYAEELQLLQAEQKMATCTGLELTGSPLPLNHQNTFPLIHKPGRQDGGAPLTDTNPDTQVRRITLWDDRSEKLIQQNHPDIGWLFYDRDGNGDIDDGYYGAAPLLHAVEIHPLTPLLDQLVDAGANAPARQSRVLDWLQLLNDGVRLTGVVNTDAHYNFHGSGGYRNWIRSSTDDPAKISTEEMVRATQAGHVIMSNGPFLEVSVRDSNDSDQEFGPGDTVVFSPEQKLHIRVQCPNWFDIDRVFVLVNGRLKPEWNFHRDAGAGFREGTVQFSHALPLRLEEDAHVVVVAAGENSQLGPVQGPSDGKRSPMAIANPIFFDVDGNGYAVSKEVIGESRPVKQQ